MHFGHRLSVYISLVPSVTGLFHILLWLTLNDFTCQVNTSERVTVTPISLCNPLLMDGLINISLWVMPDNFNQYEKSCHGRLKTISLTQQMGFSNKWVCLTLSLPITSFIILPWVMPDIVLAVKVLTR